MGECRLKADKQSRIWYQEQIAKMDPAIRALGLSQPALRALINLEVYCLSDLKKSDTAVLSNSHGIGPKAIKKLETLR